MHARTHSPHTPHTHLKPSPDKKEKFLTVLNPRRANNILIEIKRLPAARHIKAAILNMDYSYFNKEIVEVGMCGWVGECVCISTSYYACIRCALSGEVYYCELYLHATVQTNVGVQTSWKKLFFGERWWVFGGLLRYSDHTHAYSE